MKENSGLHNAYIDIPTEVAPIVTRMLKLSPVYNKRDGLFIN